MTNTNTAASHPSFRFIYFVLPFLLTAVDIDLLLHVAFDVRHGIFRLADSPGDHILSFADDFRDNVFRFTDNRLHLGDRIFYGFTANRNTHQRQSGGCGYYNSFHSA